MPIVFTHRNGEANARIRFTLDPQTSLQRVSSRLPFTYTGADLYALCSDAMLKAITRQARLVDAKVASHNAKLRPGATPLTIAGFFDHYASEEDTQVVVSEEDFDSARRELVPSVSFEELQHYEKVRQTFEGKEKKDERPKITVDGEQHATVMKKKGLREKTLSSLHKKLSRNHAAEEDGEDEYTIDTGHLNGHSNGNGKMVHKGKGKGKNALGGFGDAAGEDDEELYS